MMKTTTTDGKRDSRCDLRQDVACTARNGKVATLWRCPRCGAEVVVYVEATEVRCSCGARMWPDGEPPPAKRSEEALEVALNAG